MALSPGKTDKRLLGVWRSDRQRTIKDWVWPARTSAEHRQAFAHLFGHLTVRYTPTRVHIEYDGEKGSQEYQVLAADSDSVAILAWSSLEGEDRITQIHFEGDRFWILIPGSGQREWFKRVKQRAK
jgi:hypothetical protein